MQGIDPGPKTLASDARESKIAPIWRRSVSTTVITKNLWTSDKYYVLKPALTPSELNYRNGISSIILQESEQSIQHPILDAKLVQNGQTTHFLSRPPVSVYNSFIYCYSYDIWMAFQDRRLNSIPGPKGYPFIRIGYQLPPKPAAVFRKWAQEYGDVFKIRVGWYNWVVINTPEAVREILEKQAVHTSSKAPSPMSHDTVTGGNRMPTMPYGTQWRALRTAIRQMTTVPMTSTFVPSQEFEANNYSLTWVQIMRTRETFINTCEDMR